MARDYLEEGTKDRKKETGTKWQEAVREVNRYMWFHVLAFGAVWKFWPEGMFGIFGLIVIVYLAAIAQGLTSLCYRLEQAHNDLEEMKRRYSILHRID